MTDLQHYMEVFQLLSDLGYAKYRITNLDQWKYVYLDLAKNDNDWIRVRFKRNGEMESRINELYYNQFIAKCLGAEYVY